MLGFAPNVAVGAWSGNNDNTPIAKGVLSGLITAPMWREFMDVVLAELPEESFATAATPDPTNLKPIIKGEIIDIEALLNDVATDDEVHEANITNLYNSIHSILHFVERENPNGPYPTEPELNAQYANWEYGVNKWKEKVYGNLLKQATANQPPATVATSSPPTRPENP